MRYYYKCNTCIYGKTDYIQKSHLILNVDWFLIYLESGILNLSKAKRQALYQKHNKRTHHTNTHISKIANIIFNNESGITLSPTWDHRKKIIKKLISIHNGLKKLAIINEI